MDEILFLTTAKLATNPRLVKEVKVATENGINVDVIAFSFDSPYEDEQLDLGNFDKKNIIYLKDQKSSFFRWVFIGVIHRVLKFISSAGKCRSLQLSAFYIEKRTLSLYLHLAIHRKRYANKQLIVGHNIGAFFPAFFLAKALDIPFGIDVEDFHPGEKVLNGDPTIHRLLKERIFREILPHAYYLTYASPLIQSSTEVFAEVSGGTQSVVINNSFYSKEFSLVESEGDSVRYVWFSQYIDFGRGLEYFLDAANEINWRGISLTLIGELREDFNLKYGIEDMKSIHYKGPLTQKSLHLALCGHDVGLAIEDISNDLNRDLALTNKVFAYAQAGLFLLATATSAQKQFLELYPEQGELISLEKTSLIQTMQYLNLHKEDLRSTKSVRSQNSSRLSFENEETKLLSLWTSY